MVAPNSAGITARLCVMEQLSSLHSPFKNLTHMDLALALCFGAAALSCAVGCALAFDDLEVAGTEGGGTPRFSAPTTLAQTACFHHAQTFF